MPDEERARAAVRGAERFLDAWHGGHSPRDRLLELADATGDDERFDSYGSGDRIERLERRVAELLGKEAAVFMPSGTMAQPIALRIWSDRRGIRTVAFHPTCHLELHEEKGYERPHGLHARLVGDPNRLIRLDDLVAQVEWARERDVAMHLDGARLWESQPFYGRPHAEIAGLFDPVYVSFYKGLGGIAGAVLAGDAALVAEARVWQRSQGGNLVTLHPFVVAAEAALGERLDRIPIDADYARALAAALAEVEGVEVVPDPPQTPLFHVLLRGDRERLADAALQVAEGGRSSCLRTRARSRRRAGSGTRCWWATSRSRSSRPRSPSCMPRFWPARPRRPRARGGRGSAAERSQRAGNPPRARIAACRTRSSTPTSSSGIRAARATRGSCPSCPT